MYGNPSACPCPFFIGRLELCFCLLSVQYPGGHGLPTTVFPIVIVLWSSGHQATSQPPGSSNQGESPSMTFISMQALASQLENVGGGSYLLATERQRENTVCQSAFQQCSGRVACLYICASFRLGVGE